MDGAWRSALPELRGLTRKSAAAALAVAPPLPSALRAELSVLFTDDRSMQVLNRDYRGKDKPTNVLAFAIEDAAPSVEAEDAAREHLLGDVVLAFETVRDEAGAAGKPLAHHVSHLIVHGVLHLLGFDHQRPAEARAMEALETAALARLGIEDPYEATRPTRMGRGGRPVRQ